MGEEETLGRGAGKKEEALDGREGVGEERQKTLRDLPNFESWGLWIGEGKKGDKKGRKERKWKEVGRKESRKN